MNTSPPSPAHRHAARAHKRNGRGRFVPLREFPDTGTPDVIVPPHREKLHFDRSERIRTSEEIVPRHDRTERIRPEGQDWLDKDAASSFLP